MTFVSFPFIVFVAITTLVYFLTPKKFQWIVLLISSYVFYWFNSHWLLLILMANTLVTYGIGRWIDSVSINGKQYLKDHNGELSKEEKKAHKERTKKKTRHILWLGILIDLGTLLFLKYFNFFAENVNGILSAAGSGVALPHLNLLLPLGISFYTMQAIAYMTDIYRGKLEADRNPFKFMLFMSFFPQIIQGPIPRHNQLARQLYEGHSFDYTRLTRGAQLMLWGWMKKLIIADRVAIPVNQIFNNYSDYSGMMIFLGAALYGLQVYADFSGGMDIARGVSQILGIELEINFNQPYFSTSIEDFWRRWHMTLGSWMKDYIFYPLSLSKLFMNISRKSRKYLGQFIGKRLPAFMAMFIVYLLVGFLPGSSGKYVAYGIYNAVFIMSGILLEDVYKNTRMKVGIDESSFTWRLFQMGRTFFLLSLGRIITKAYRLMAAVEMFRLMLKQWWDLSFIFDGSLIDLGLDNANWILVFISMLVLLTVDFLHEKGVPLRETIARQHVIFRWMIYITAILCVAVLGIYGPEYDAASFIYGQF